MKTGPMRGLLNEPVYDAAAQKIFGSDSEADDRLQALTFLLSNETDFARYVSIGNWRGHPLQVARIDQWIDLPEVFVFFSVNPHTGQIHLVDIQV
jgi:hypothetical protein